MRLLVRLVTVEWSGAPPRWSPGDAPRCCRGGGPPLTSPCLDRSSAPGPGRFQSMLLERSSSTENELLFSYLPASGSRRDGLLSTANTPRLPRTSASPFAWFHMVEKSSPGLAPASGILRPLPATLAASGIFLSRRRARLRLASAFQS